MAEMCIHIPFFNERSMKKIPMLITIMFFSIVMTAKERTLEEKKVIAEQILNTFNGQFHRAMPLDKDLGVLHSNESLTVLGHENAGFVIVANNDAFDPVVGYSDSSFSLEDNNHLVWFLSTVTETMQNKMLNGKTSSAHASPKHSSLQPLLSSVWNQSAPFNDLCPVATNGSHYPCGCVATALGQIMYFHKYPDIGAGEKQYSFKPADGVGELLSANFGETHYEWNNMLDSYESGNYTSTQAHAVAEMILHCGVSVEMNYTPTGSGAYSSEAKTGLSKHFRYNENLGLFYRTYYSRDAWMNLIYQELDSNRPIYYAGSDASRGGHAFVLDGYNAEGLVHVNWGWGSNGGNGYYDISLLNPPGYSFANSQNMILGIATPTTEIEYQSHIVSDNPFGASIVKYGSNYYLSSVSIGTSLWNLSGSAWAGSLGIIVQNSAHTYVLQTRTISTTADRYNVLSNINESFKSLIKIPTDIADGEYHVFVASKDEWDKDWRLVRRSEGVVNSCILTVSDGSITIENTTDDTWNNNTTTGISVLPASGISNSTRYFDLQGREVSGDTKGLLIRKQGNEVKKVIVK